MAVKASVTITISKYRDTDSITRYYKLQASTAAAPAVPTTLTPSGWSTSEPTYTSGSTNTLYYTDCVVFSDGTFQYTDDGNGKAVKSSSYEAAKEAYNKAQAAQNTINNMEIGGRNLLLDSAFPVGTNKWTKNTVDTTVRYMNNNSMRLKLGGERLDVPGQYFSSYITNKKLVLTYYIMCPDVSKLTTNIDSWIGFRKEGYIANGAINKQIAPNELTDNVWKKITITGFNSDPTNIYCTMMIQPNNPTATLYIACPKLEYGDKATDWSPAPEDIDNTIAKTVKQVDVEYYLSTSSSSPTGGSWSTTAPTWVDGKYMWSRQKVTYVDGTTTTRNETCIAGAKGSTGNPGAIGTGINSITEEYYLSTSKTTQTGGSWSTTPPTWQTGKYIWTRSKIVYKNPTSTTYTTPICSSEWEAINDVSIGARNLLVGSSIYREDTPFMVENVTTNDAFYTLSRMKFVPIIGEYYIIQVKCDKEVSPMHSSSSQDAKGKFTIWFYVRNIGTTKSWGNYDSAVCFTSSDNTNDKKYLGSKDDTYYWLYKIPNNVLDICIRVNTYADSENPVTIKWWDFKIEKGNKPTDWTPAPEDTDEAIETVSAYAQNVANELLTTKGQLTAASTRIDSLQGVIENFVKDDNGMVTVTQTGSGMQIDMTQATNRINQLLTAIESAVTEGEANQLRTELLAAIQAVQSRTAYINATQDAQGRPVITLGATDSPFKVEITNEAINFIQNGQVIAYANGQKFYNLRTVVQQDVQIGIGPGFIWKTRDSGNMGLTWVPAQS